MSKKFFICGHFAFDSKNIDGQIIKTRNLKSLLDQNGSVKYLDTFIFFSKKIFKNI